MKKELLNKVLNGISSKEVELKEKECYFCSSACLSGIFLVYSPKVKKEIPDVQKLFSCCYSCYSEIWYGHSHQIIKQGCYDRDINNFLNLDLKNLTDEEVVELH